MVLSYLPGAQVNFLSADSTEDTEVANTYPSEFLNTLEVSGMPSHELLLKIGTPMILLCNLDPLARLCNGMRLIVRRFTMRVVEVEIITGKRPVMWPLSCALSSFPITTVCHLHCKEAISFAAGLCHDY